VTEANDVVPINAPPRAELWRRNQVALSILGHRPLLPTSVADELRRVLRGEDVAAAGGSRRLEGGD
jgi:hypothetical protein